MSDPDTPSLFTPKWLAALLKGQRPAGETFWVGNYGTALFHQPILAVMLVLPLPSILPGLLTALLTVYQLVLSVAVARAQPNVPTPTGWKIAGILVTLGNAALFATLTSALW
ncbi:hypothetical protein J7382_18485 [Shimia sp. R11_0]|uniref:hypothetical protein n=1 Tax=Shimia sp. R11_0 TaxID=2821096 RepID=UPI001ADA3105|nr:hypothetical protein [Shimia sp. R11_0]MBO9479538.1 hypothetical protein [Shimia sp. R11_0]